MSSPAHPVEIVWMLRPLLDGHQPNPITRYALQKEAGVAMNTIRAMYDSTSKGVDFTTLSKVLSALRVLTGDNSLDVADLLTSRK